MRLNKYIFLSILLMVLVGGVVYSQIHATYTLEVLGVPVTLPVAAWIVLPMFLMFLASFFHMAYYSFINFMVLKRYKKDYDVLIQSLADAIMREPKSHNYKTREAKNMGHVIDRSDVTPRDFKIATKDERLKKVLEYVKDITNGIYVEINDYKLSPSNPLLVQNYENRLKEEPTYSGVILKNCDNLPDKLCKDALRIYMEFSEPSKIKEYAKLFDLGMLATFFEVMQQKGQKIEYSDILYILQESPMQPDSKAYIQLAKEVKSVLAPDERLKLFEILKNKDEKSEGAYLFTLLDLEMIDKAKEFLETVQEGEHENFKAYLDLKECGRNYPLELFV